MSDQKKPTWKFTVEFGDDTLRSFLLTSLKLMVRGAFNKGRWHSRPGGGADLSPANGVQDIPGSYLEIDCRAMKGRLHDPLNDNPKMVEQHNDLAARNPAIRKIRPHDDSELTFNPDLLKTLLLELNEMESRGSLRVVSGTMPSAKELEDVDGRQLYDMWNSSHYKPKYADEAEAYYSKMSK